MRNWWMSVRRGRDRLFAAIRANPSVFLIVTVLTVGTVVVLAFAIPRSTASPSADTEPTDHIAQVLSVTSNTTMTPLDDPTTPGWIPVEVVTSTEFLRMLDNPGAQQVSDAVISPSTYNAGAVFSATKSAPVIYAAHVLPEQVPAALDGFAANDADVTVASPGSARVAAGAYGKGLGGQAGGESDSGPNWFVFAMLGILSVTMFLFIFSALQRRRAAQAMANNAANSSGSAVFAPGSKKKADGAAVPPDTRFSDVAGCDEAIEELHELVMFLKEPERFTRTGATPPSGALLVGPPGTGKTLLARAVAGESNVPFFTAAGSDFVEMYVGVGAKRIRELFARARKQENGAIIFIDEIDAIGRKRSTNASGSTGNQETENTLNALLVEMDGFKKSNVIVIAATNRDDLLDDALKRPGRLDRKVQVPLPDRLGRFKILQVHATGKPLADDVDLDLMARRSPGMSGAELAQLVNEACMNAARDDRDEVTHDDFDAALATVAMGRARTSAVVTPHDRLVTAWHEAGHTVSAMVLEDADDPVSVSIIPRGPAGGVTWMAQGDDLFLTRRRAFARLVVAMSGRAAEELLLDGEFTSGPHGDLTAATNTALAMVAQYGMTDVGLMIRSEGLLSTGSKITDETVDAVERLLAEALDVARATLNDHRDLLDKIVDGLLEFDTLGVQQLRDIQEGRTVAMPAPPAPKNYRRPAPERVASPVPAADASPSGAASAESPLRWRPARRGRTRRLVGAVSAAVQAWKGQGPAQPAG